MNLPFTLLPNLSAEIEPPVDGILTRTVFQDDRLKVVLFGFGKGQELSEHTSSMPAVLHFLSGEAEVTLGAETLPAAAGTWIHMTPHLPHGILAHAPTVMLLLLLKEGNASRD